jgi:hypothetical protein
MRLSWLGLCFLRYIDLFNLLNSIRNFSDSDFAKELRYIRALVCYKVMFLNP